MSKPLFSKGECFVLIGLLDRVLKGTRELSSDWLSARGVKDLVLMTLGEHSLAELGLEKGEAKLKEEEEAEEPIIGEE